jgi:GNAT superfamily N-acetyltransferase
METISREITVWHLELFHNATIKVPRDGTYRLDQQTELTPQFNRYLYTAVGSHWYWYKRLNWSYGDWQSYLQDPAIEVWVAYLQADPIGYFELSLEAGKSVEITYFGLLPNFIGRGFGGTLLTDAIDRAFVLGGNRVWLHTCTLDHRRALQNYRSRGFKVFKEESFTTQLPAEPLQPWQGAKVP